MNYNELSKKAHESAVKHGFWERKWSKEHCLMLILTEVSELVEADRKNRHADIPSYQDGLRKGGFEHCFKENVKDTIEDEFADIAIRLLDLAGALGIDFDKMHPCGYYRAFDKFDFTENAFALCKGLSRDVIGIEKRILFGLDFVKGWTTELGISLKYHITLKMAYNESREIRHGKLY